MRRARSPAFRSGLVTAVDEAEVRALLDHAELLVTSPSISPHFPTTEPWLREALLAAEARGVELVSEVELFLRLTRARIVGITGTKGKTTTASLVAAIFQQAGMPSVLGGNIGTPLIERADELSADDWAILELSRAAASDDQPRSRPGALHERRGGSPRPAWIGRRVPGRQGSARGADGSGRTCGPQP